MRSERPSARTSSASSTPRCTSSKRSERPCSSAVRRASPSSSSFTRPDCNRISASRGPRRIGAATPRPVIGRSGRRLSPDRIRRRSTWRRSSARWQADRRPGTTSRSGGASAAQRATARGQRVPEGAAARGRGLARAAPPRIGEAAHLRARRRGQERPRVGVERRVEERVGRRRPRRCRPAKSTATRPARWRTTPSWCAIRRYAKPRPRPRGRASRFRICACTDTSSDETGSSRSRSSGSSASARARPTRWRWPPESSCG